MFSAFTPMVLKLLWSATLETLYMTFASGFFGALFGIPLGVLLFTTRPGQIFEHKWLNHALSAIVNLGRSVPFVILLVAIIPFTMLLLGTFIGTTAAIVPLSVSAVPLVARLVEGALLDVPAGLTEAARSMGASKLQIVWKFLLPEATPSLITTMTITLVSRVNDSAMAGTVGGGGLGYVGIQWGYQTYNPPILIATIVILVIMVQAIQLTGDALVAHFRHRAR